ncbi:unnamed protein product, partial [Mesorhabditis spiculigera]
MTLTNLRLAARQKKANRRRAVPAFSPARLPWAQIIAGYKAANKPAPPVSSVELPTINAPQLAITWPFELPSPRADLGLNGHLCAPTPAHVVNTIDLPLDKKLISTLPLLRQPLLAICAPPAPPVLKGGADFAVLMGSRYFDQFRNTPSAENSASTTSTVSCRHFFSSASTVSVDSDDGYMADLESPIGSVQFESQAHFYEYDAETTEDSELSTHSSAGRTPIPTSIESQASHTISNASLIGTSFYPNEVDGCDCSACCRVILSMAACPLAMQQLMARSSNSSITTAATSISSLLLDFYADGVEGCHCKACSDAMKVLASCPIAQQKLLRQNSNTSSSTESTSDLSTEYSYTRSVSSAFFTIPAPVPSDLAREPVVDAEMNPWAGLPLPMPRTREVIQQSLDYWEKCQLICAERVRSTNAALARLNTDG